MRSTGGARTANGSPSSCSRRTRSPSGLRGSDLVGWRYRGPFDDLPPGSEVEHRVIPWDDVTMDQGTGIVHIAPGCGGEDFELSKVHELAGPDAGRRVGTVLRRLRLAARALDDRGRRPDHRPARRDRLPRRGGARTPTRYPHCWRCDTPLIFRLSDDWFICGGSGSAAAARREREGASGSLSTWASAWTTGFATWATGTSRGAAYYGLPLPFYPCSCGHLTVVGSKTELRERATEGFDQLEELRRPWVDRVPIRLRCLR